MQLMELRAATDHLRNLHQELLSAAPAEGAAFLAVEPSRGRLVLHSYRVFRRDELEGDGYGELALREEPKVDALAAIKQAGHALVEAHTHPGAAAKVAFSSYDEEELPAFARYVRLKLPGRPFGAVVFGSEGYTGRTWSDHGVVPLTITGVGEAGKLVSWTRPNGDQRLIGGSQRGRYDRQTRALGDEGQQTLASLKVGIVGLGGTGSLVVQQLAHLGLRRFVLVEDDRVEHSNLPRLAGAAWWDALLRRRKTAVARRLIRRVAMRTAVQRPGSLRTQASLSALADVDLIIGCVDNDGARLVLSELAAAHLIPYLDIGVGIEAGSSAEQVGGRVGFYLPGGPCLACADELDFSEAAEDLESEELRRVRVDRAYASDRRVEPALMPLNTVVVGLAMIELLAFATGLRRVTPFLRYDALAARTVRQHVELEAQCPVCQPAFGMGDRHRIERFALAA
jgi:molybdopterin-synthase adenylyltransferase